MVRTDDVGAAYAAFCSPAAALVHADTAPTCLRRGDVVDGIDFGSTASGRETRSSTGVEVDRRRWSERTGRRARNRSVRDAVEGRREWRGTGHRGCPPWTRTSRWPRHLAALVGITWRVYCLCRPTILDGGFEALLARPGARAAAGGGRWIWPTGKARSRLSHDLRAARGSATWPRRTARKARRAAEVWSAQMVGRADRLSFPLARGSACGQRASSPVADPPEPAPTWTARGLPPPQPPRTPARAQARDAPTADAAGHDRSKARVGATLGEAVGRDPAASADDGAISGRPTRRRRGGHRDAVTPSRRSGIITSSRSRTYL